MRIAIFLCSALALPLALAACSGSEDGDAQTAQVESPATGSKEQIDLRADGLTVPPQGGDDALEVPFGSMRAATEATLALVLGEVVSRQESSECPAGLVQSTQYQGLTLNFQDDQFVGWIASEPYMPEETRAALLEGGGILLVEDSTLGDEFVIGDPQLAVISGLFGDGGDNAHVTDMWAGINCIFR